MTVTPVIKTGDVAIRRRAPRLSGEMRRAQIIEAACQFFAEHGFSGPTRDLAASIGVTQALLYRYFDSKTDLIDAVFAAVFRGEWGDGARERFETAEGTTADRIVEVYQAMLPRMTGVATRLLLRAGLDCYAGPIYRNASIGDAACAAIVEAWRRDEGLPPLAVRPMLEGEQALVVGLHEAMLMIRVREHVLHAVRTLEDADEIRLTADTYDFGVRGILRRMHESGAGVGRPAALPVAEALEAA